MEKFHLALQFSSKREKFILRQKASDGIWVSFLLPIAVVVGAWKTESSHLYKLSAVYSVNLLLNVVHLFYHVQRKNSIYVTKSLNILCAIPSSITIFLYISTLHLDFTQSLCYTIANALIFFEGLPFILQVFPNSFTFGEAIAFIQGLSLFLYSTFIRLSKVLSHTVPSDECSDSTTILQIGLLGMLILCIVPFVCQKIRSAFHIYIWMIIVLICLIPVSLNYVLKRNPFLWLWTFFINKERGLLLTLWLTCVFITAIIIWHRIQVKKQADTIIRKYFHILAAIVYVTGIIFDTNLIYFSSGCVLAVFILMEIFRILRIPPLSEFLQNSFILYADEKDSGIVALTPIYLLTGLSLPLWIYPTKIYSNTEYLQLLSGVLCVGIGDTCASIVGKTLGKHLWQGSKKTVEGTVACILGQVIIVLILTFSGYVSLSGIEYFKIVVAIVVPSFIEALTDQIDNIILPLVTYTLLMV